MRLAIGSTSNAAIAVVMGLDVGAQHGGVVERQHDDAFAGSGEPRGFRDRRAARRARRPRRGCGLTDQLTSSYEPW